MLNNRKTIHKKKKCGPNIIIKLITHHKPTMPQEFWWIIDSDWSITASCTSTNGAVPWPSQSLDLFRWWIAAGTGTLSSPHRGSSRAWQCSHAWWVLSAFSAWTALRWTWCFQATVYVPCPWHPPAPHSGADVPLPKGKINIFILIELFHILCTKLS